MTYRAKLHLELHAHSLGKTYQSAQGRVSVSRFQLADITLSNSGKL